nr:histidine phosphatase family protein [Shewanella jiangmenensis]
MVSELYILRHGQTEFNAERRLQGHCNSPLTPLGQAQAQAYGNRLKKLGNLDDFQLISSPLGRAMQTAALVAQTLGRDERSIIADERIKEAGLGEFEQACIPELHAANPHFANLPGWYLQALGAEPLNAIQARLQHFLRDDATPGKAILISHGITSMILRAMLQGLDDDAIWALDRPQDAFYHFSDGKLRRIECD